MTSPDDSRLAERLDALEATARANDQLIDEIDQLIRRCRAELRTQARRSKAGPRPRRKR